MIGAKLKDNKVQTTDNNKEQLQNRVPQLFSILNLDDRKLKTSSLNRPHDSYQPRNQHFLTHEPALSSTPH